MGKDLDLAEDLQGADDGDDGNQHQGRADKRQGYSIELFERWNAVHARGFMELARHTLQGRQKQHHVEADAFECLDDNERNHGGVRQAEPVGAFDAHHVEKAIDAAIGLQQKAPDDGPGHHGHDDRREE